MKALSGVMLIRMLVIWIFVRDVERAMKSLFDDTYYLVAINLKYANEVYVVDNSKYYKKRNEMFEMIAPRDVLTDDELGRAYASRGETLVSISEYKGEYMMNQLY